MTTAERIWSVLLATLIGVLGAALIVHLSLCEGAC